MMTQQDAYDWVNTAPVGTPIPPEFSLSGLTALAVKELIWRHEKLAEAVMGILTDMDPSTIDMSQDEYRQLLREQVSKALTGSGL